MKWKKSTNLRKVEKKRKKKLLAKQTKREEYERDWEFHQRKEKTNKINKLFSNTVNIFEQDRWFEDTQNRKKKISKNTSLTIFWAKSCCASVVGFWEAQTNQKKNRRNEVHINCRYSPLRCGVWIDSCFIGVAHKQFGPVVCSDTKTKRTAQSVDGDDHCEIT